jgi:hypothetical protein
MQLSSSPREGSSPLSSLCRGSSLSTCRPVGLSLFLLRSSQAVVSPWVCRRWSWCPLFLSHGWRCLPTSSAPSHKPPSTHPLWPLLPVVTQVLFDDLISGLDKASVSRHGVVTYKRKKEICYYLEEYKSMRKKLTYYIVKASGNASDIHQRVKHI